MEWFTLKNALVYGHPQLDFATVPPDFIRPAAREIVRLVEQKWLDTLTEDALSRIQQACETGQCTELLEGLDLWRGTGVGVYRKNEGIIKGINRFEYVKERQCGNGEKVYLSCRERGMLKLAGRTVVVL